MTCLAASRSHSVARVYKEVFVVEEAGKVSAESRVLKEAAHSPCARQTKQSPHHQSINRVPRPLSSSFEVEPRKVVTTPTMVSSSRVNIADDI